MPKGKAVGRRSNTPTLTIKTKTPESKKPETKATVNKSEANDKSNRLDSLFRVFHETTEDLVWKLAGHFIDNNTSRL